MFATDTVLAYQVNESACIDVVNVQSLCSSSSLHEFCVSLGKNAAFSIQKITKQKLGCGVG